MNTNGENLAPGYVFDLPNRTNARWTFTAETYPGLAELLAANPGLSLGDLVDGCDEVAFQFHIAAAATAMNRDEFVAHQSQVAEANSRIRAQ